jgi:hypothetical protein
VTADRKSRWNKARRIVDLEPGWYVGTFDWGMLREVTIPTAVLPFGEIVRMNVDDLLDSNPKARFNYAVEQMELVSLELRKILGR